MKAGHVRDERQALSRKFKAIASACSLKLGCY
jgi:hypothetical protein